MTAAAILKRAAEIITPPGSWGQGQTAVDKDGRQVPSSSTAAVCFCALGAINRATRELQQPEHVSQRAYQLTNLELVDVAPSAINLPAWNDAPGRTQQEVVDLLHKAASRCQP